MNLYTFVQVEFTSVIILLTKNNGHGRNVEFCVGRASDTLQCWRSAILKSKWCKIYAPQTIWHIDSCAWKMILLMEDSGSLLNASSCRASCARVSTPCHPSEIWWPIRNWCLQRRSRNTHLVQCWLGCVANLRIFHLTQYIWKGVANRFYQTFSLVKIDTRSRYQPPWPTRRGLCQ